MKRLLFIAVLLLAAARFPAAAATGTDAGTPDPRREAVLELLEVCRTPQTLESTVNGLVEQQLKETPELEPGRQVLLDFYRECFNYDSLREEIVATYLKYFTLEEIQAITAFYRTPAGQKLAERGAELSTAGLKIANERMQRNLPELQKKLEKVLAE